MISAPRVPSLGLSTHQGKHSLHWAVSAVPDNRPPTLVTRRATSQLHPTRQWAYPLLTRQLHNRCCTSSQQFPMSSSSVGESASRLQNEHLFNRWDHCLQILCKTIVWRSFRWDCCLQNRWLHIFLARVPPPAEPSPHCSLHSHPFASDSFSSSPSDPAVGYDPAT